MKILDRTLNSSIVKKKLFARFRWHATGFLNLNSTCSDEDVITFNGENYRQLCSPIVELGRIDSIRFTLSAGLTQDLSILNHSIFFTLI